VGRKKAEMPTKSPQSIAIINFKGGVGKTTTTWCISNVLTSALNSNLSVLMFDIDAQMSLTQVIALDESTGRLHEQFWRWHEKAFQHRHTVFHALTNFYQSGQKFDFSMGTDFTYQISPQFHFIPSVDELYWLDFDRPNRERTKDFIQRLIDKITSSSELPNFDYLIFDCPNAITPLSYSVLSCCDLILIPVTPDFFATRGLGTFLKFLRIRIAPYPFPKVAVFMNRIKTAQGQKPTQESIIFMQNIKKVCDDAAASYNLKIKLLDTFIRDRVGIKIDKALKEGLQEEIVQDFQKLWHECVEFIG
jgi:chromosome partitioning protein